MLARDFSDVGKNHVQFGGEGNHNGEFWYPGRICSVRDNTKVDAVAVADTCNNRVQVLSTKGEYKYGLGRKGRDPGQFLMPCAVAVSLRHDVIAVVDSGNHRVQLFAKYGRSNVPTVLGKKGDGPGELNNPTGACWCGDDGQELLVVDSSNHRLHFFRPFAVEAKPWTFGSKGTGGRRGEFLFPEDATWHDGSTFNDDEAALKETVLSDPTMSKASLSVGHNAPLWWLGSVNKTAAFQALEDSPVGHWRVRKDTSTADTLCLCFVSSESYRKHDIEERVIRQVAGKFQLHLTDADRKRLSEGKSDSAAVKPTKYAALSDLLADSAKYFSLVPQPDGRRATTIAVADTSNNRVVFLGCAAVLVWPLLLAPPRARARALSGGARAQVHPPAGQPL